MNLTSNSFIQYKIIKMQFLKTKQRATYHIGHNFDLFGNTRGEIIHICSFRINCNRRWRAQGFPFLNFFRNYFLSFSFNRPFRWNITLTDREFVVEFVIRRLTFFLFSKRWWFFWIGTFSTAFLEKNEQISHGLVRTSKHEHIHKSAYSHKEIPTYVCIVHELMWFD